MLVGISYKRKVGKRLKISLSYNDKDLVIEAKSVYLKSLSRTIVAHTNSGTYYIKLKNIPSFVLHAVMNNEDLQINNVFYIEKKRKEHYERT